MTPGRSLPRLGGVICVVAVTGVPTVTVLAPASVNHWATFCCMKALSFASFAR